MLGSNGLKYLLNFLKLLNFLYLLNAPPILRKNICLICLFKQIKQTFDFADD